MRLSSSFQRGSELADKSTNAPFSQKSAHIFSYAFLHSAKFGIEAASGFDGENSQVNSRVSEFESNSNSCGVCVGLNFAPSENLTAAKYLVESSSREITAAFFSGVSSALLCFCGEFQSPERLAVCASEYGNEKITRSFPGFKSFDDIFTDTASRSGCETVVTRAFFPSAGELAFDGLGVHIHHLPCRRYRVEVEPLSVGRENCESNPPEIQPVRICGEPIPKAAGWRGREGSPENLLFLWANLLNYP